MDALLFFATLALPVEVLWVFWLYLSPPTPDPLQRGTMLGLDVCEFGGQVLELLWLTMCYRGEAMKGGFTTTSLIHTNRCRLEVF